MSETPSKNTGPIVPKHTPLPPPRPGVRYVNVPVIGIVIADDPLRRRINRRFHWPMIVLALLTLPAFAIEFFVRPDDFTWLWWANWTAIWSIWTAFVIEFAVKIAIAESRPEYCKRNWLDIIIIIVPALRAFRIASVARTTRVFTLRGVGMKLARYVFTIVLGLEATDRLLARIGINRKPGRKDPARMTRHELMTEVKRLRTLSDQWESWYAAHQAIAEELDRPMYAADPPRLVDEAPIIESLPTREMMERQGDEVQSAASPADNPIA